MDKKKIVPEGRSPLAYTVDEFCRLAHISKSTLYKLWREGKGPKYRQVGDRRIITHENGTAWLNEAA